MPRPEDGASTEVGEPASNMRRSGGQLHEREGVMDAIRALIDQARAGKCGTLFVIGEAGLGKSAVLDFARQTAGREFLIASADADPMESSLAFGYADQMLDPLRVRGGDATPEDPRDRRGARFTDALGLLRLHTDQPLLLALDNLHWADGDSLAMISYLCRRLAGLPIAVVATLRPWPDQPRGMVWMLAQGDYAQVQELAPLGPGGAAALLRAHVGAGLSDEIVERAHRVCGGNPLLLKQLAATNMRGEDLPDDAGGLAIPAWQRWLLLGPFASLPPTAIRWANAASALGPRFHPEIVAMIAGLDDSEADEAEEAIWASGLLRSAGDGRMEYVHELFSQAVYDDMSPSIRARLHARALDLLADRGMDAEACEHAARAGLAGGRRAADLLLAAGTKALAAGAVAAGANHLAAAAALRGDEVPTSLLIRLCEALILSGRHAEAVTSCETLLARDLPMEDVPHVLWLLGRAAQEVGDLARARRCLGEAAALSTATRPDLAVDVLVHLALTTFLTVGPAAALEFATQARDLAQPLDSQLQMSAATAWSLISLTLGSPAGLEVASAATNDIIGRGREAIQSCFFAGRTAGLVCFAVGAVDVERFDEADNVLGLVGASAEEVGAETPLVLLDIVRSVSLIPRFRADEARDLVGRLRAGAGMMAVAPFFAGVVESYFLLEAGEIKEADAIAKPLQALAADLGLWWIDLSLQHIRAVGYLREGDVERASDAYLRIEDRSRELRLGSPCVVRWARHATIAHAAAGRVDAVRRIVAWLQAASEELPCRWPGAAAHHGRAALAEASGDAAAANHHYVAAERLLRKIDLPAVHAEVLLAHGSFIRRSGHPKRARPLLAEAQQAAESIGATWLARQAHEELKAAGGRRRRSRHDRELTPQERRVATLAATGVTDKAIARRLSVSVSTVRTHLEHVFMKLDIHSRRDLMVMDLAAGDGVAADERR